MNYRVNQDSSLEGERVKWTPSPASKRDRASKGSGHPPAGLKLLLFETSFMQSGRNVRTNMGASLPTANGYQQ